MMALEGTRVLDLTRFIAGPYCTMMLGDLGAEVVKIEPAGDGERTRRADPIFEGQSLYAIMFNRNKKSLTVDLRSKKGVALLLRLAAKADVLVENFRPGTMEKMGCGWDVLSRTNQRLIMTRISGFGQDGPYAQRPSLDAVGQAMGGLMELTGDPEGPPMRCGPYVSDYTTAMYATIGTLAALQARDRIGRGQVVDVSLLDSASSMLMSAFAERRFLGRAKRRTGNRDPYITPTSTFPTKDGAWVYLIAGNQIFFPRFARAIGRPELIDDDRFATTVTRAENRVALEEVVTAWTMGHTAAEIVTAMEQAELPCAKVATIDDVFENPQLRHRGQIVEMDQPGLGSVPMPGVTIHLSETPLTIRGPMPAVGADTEAVLADWLNESYPDSK